MSQIDFATSRLVLTLRLAYSLSEFDTCENVLEAIMTMLICRADQAALSEGLRTQNTPLVFRGIQGAIPVIRSFQTAGLEALLQNLPSDLPPTVRILCESIQLIFSAMRSVAAGASASVSGGGGAGASVSGGGGAGASGGVSGGVSTSAGTQKPSTKQAREARMLAALSRTPEEAIAAADAGESCCDWCQKPTNQACAGCRSFFFCKKSCQRKAWKEGGHKQTCPGKKTE